MSGYLLDTHIWLWYLDGSDRLPAGIRKLIDTNPTEHWLSPISIWEAGNLVQRAKSQIKTDFAGWLHKAILRCPLKEANINNEVAKTVFEISLPHRDPADYFLASTAIVFGLTVLAVDRHLLATKWLPTRSD